MALPNATRFAPLAVAAALGCSATTGSSWVHAPEPGLFAADDPALTASEPSGAEFDGPLASQFRGGTEVHREREPLARPRLDRTITLGETIATGTARAEAAQPADGAAVHVTINNYATAPVRDVVHPVIVGGVRDDVGSPRPARPIPRARPGAPARDWPALPSYGPAFPFKTAPASPWR